MKKGIHPAWFHDCVVTCSCGSSFTTGATVKTLQVDICSSCHPFFTGEMKFVDRQGRVDKFRQKMQLAQAKQAASKKQKKQDKKAQGDAKSYRQILQEQKTKIKKVAGSQAPVAAATNASTSSTASAAK